jgi:phage-related minor tail protein
MEAAMTEERDQDMRAKLEAQYDKFADRFRELFEAGQDKSREAMEKAMERAREQLAAAGEFTLNREKSSSCTSSATWGRRQRACIGWAEKRTSAQIRSGCAQARCPLWRSFWMPPEILCRPGHAKLRRP